MEAARWSRLKDAFATLSELAPSERDTELAALQASDPEIAQRVAQLLEAETSADAVMRRFDLLPDAFAQTSVESGPTGEPNAGDHNVASDPFGYAGQTVSQYRVRDVLGIGGMGVVYRAEDTRLGRDIALKFLLPQYSVDPLAKERFLQEARAASSLDHPNVCTVHGVGTSDQGHLFLAMACYDGETLKSRLARSSLTVSEATLITRQILLGLRAAHGAGIIHRDLKPGNVMLLPDGVVKILDFGLAKVSDRSLTGPGLRPGTVAYMSPEQVEGKPIDARTDLWSLGVVLYEMLAGQQPFGGGHDLGTVYAILNAEPPPPSQLRSEVPAAYDVIVRRLLRKDRDERYASATDVVADLDAAAAGQPVHVGEVIEPPVRSRRSPAVVAAAILGGVMLVAALATLPMVRGAATSAPRDAPASVDAPTVDARSVAVLPFVDMSPRQDQAYFSDGITEEILNALTKMPELHVPARTSSFSFKGRNLPVRDIARQLGVALVLEGSVRKDGERVRITAQLIEAQSDRRLWSETFDRTVDDVFGVQAELARTVAEALKVQLGAAGAIVAAPSAPNARAHDLYLQGRFHWNRRSGGEDFRRAIGFFKDAIRADSAYAQAHAGLALAYAVLPINTGETPAEPPLRRAVAAATRAIALDSTNAEAHAALGYAQHMLYRWADAERSLRRATELDPASSAARQWYAEHLVKMGRGREAEDEVRRAVALDPLSPLARANLALILMLDGRYNEAIGEAERTSRMDPSLSIPQVLLHRLYLLEGRLDESATAGRRFAELRGMDNSADYVTLAYGPRGRAERAAALAVLDRWARAPRPQWGEIAMYAAVLDDRARALKAIDQGLRVRAPMMAGLKVAKWLDPLRGEPRFEQTLRELRFP